MEVEKIDKMGYVDIGRVKWIEALYMTTRLNNSFVYSYNNPIRWVDILGLRPGDVFYHLDDLIDDLYSFISPLVNKNKIEYGTGVRLFKQYDEQKKVCVQAYIYTMPYGWEKYSWDPSRAMEGACASIILIHMHGEWNIQGISEKDINITNYYLARCPNYSMSIILLPNKKIIYY